MIRVNLFNARETDIALYNAKALLDWAIEFYTDECDGDFIESEEDFTFPSYASAYFRVFNERDGIEIKEITNIAKSNGNLIINASVLDMTFEDLGMYFYEIGYIQTGGYEIALMFGKLQIV